MYSAECPISRASSAILSSAVSTRRVLFVVDEVYCLGNFPDGPPDSSKVKRLVPAAVAGISIRNPLYLTGKRRFPLAGHLSVRIARRTNIPIDRGLLAMALGANNKPRPSRPGLDSLGARWRTDLPTPACLRHGRAAPQTAACRSKPPRRPRDRRLASCALPR